MNTQKMLIAANWKMNPVPEGALQPSSEYVSTPTVDTIVFPTSLDIERCIQSNLITGGQAARSENIGAFTGDISMAMLKASGCTYVLCGHSERRKYHNETNEEVGSQASAAIEHGLIPIVCIGETEQERKEGIAETIVYMQLQELPLAQVRIIAYEPVWAIGTGNTATPEQAEAMHAFIRSKLPEHAKHSTRILYGGSMKSSNAHELLSQPNIDGGLIGSAALDPTHFKEIVHIAETIVM